MKCTLQLIRTKRSLHLQLFVAVVHHYRRRCSALPLPGHGKFNELLLSAIRNSKKTEKLKLIGHNVAGTSIDASVSLIFIINYYSGVLHIGIEIKTHRDYYFILGC